MSGHKPWLEEVLHEGLTAFLLGDKNDPDHASSRRVNLDNECALKIGLGVWIFRKQINLKLIGGQNGL